MYNHSPAYYQGVTDGCDGKPLPSRDELHAMPYQDAVDYLVGWEHGEAQASGTFDPMTEEERQAIYGDESS